MNILVSDKIEFQIIIMTFKMFESCIVTKGESIKDPYVVQEKSFIKVNVNSIFFPKNENGFPLRHLKITLHNYL